jgi:chromosome segregation ATPase
MNIQIDILALLGIFITILTAAIAGTYWISKQFTTLKDDSQKCTKQEIDLLRKEIQDMQKSNHTEFDKIEGRFNQNKLDKLELVNDLTKNNDDYHLQLHLKQSALDERIEAVEKNFNEVKSELVKISKKIDDFKVSNDNYKKTINEYIGALFNSSLKDFEERLLTKHTLKDINFAETNVVKTKPRK